MFWFSVPVQELCELRWCSERWRGEACLPLVLAPSTSFLCLTLSVSRGFSRERARARALTTSAIPWDVSELRCAFLLARSETLAVANRPRRAGKRRCRRPSLAVSARLFPIHLSSCLRDRAAFVNKIPSFDAGPHEKQVPDKYRVPRRLKIYRRRPETRRFSDGPPPTCRRHTSPLRAVESRKQTSARERERTGIPGASKTFPHPVYEVGTCIHR